MTKAIEVNATTLGLTTIGDDTFDICRSYYTANQTLERKAEKVGELRSALAMHLVDELGYDTPEHWISPNTRDSKSALSTAQYSDSLNMFSTFIGDTYKGLLPKTLSNGIKFALGTEDVDDYGKNHPRRKLIIDAGRQPASIQKDFAKIAMGLVNDRKAESMTDDEKVAHLMRYLTRSGQVAPVTPPWRLFFVFLPLQGLPHLQMFPSPRIPSRRRAPRAHVGLS